MRLTLRTLLAWLDSLLPPQEQQALAEKVAASPVAPTLVRRIQDVVENAGVGAPRIDARGLADDANSVAEYLDNCLPAERLADFERICIESDIHLAEVAACHGVLAEMSREPGVVAPLDVAARKRLLSAIRDHIAAHPVEPVEAGRAAGSERPATGRDAPLRPASPSARRARRAPLVAWGSAAVAVALLVGLVGFFFQSLAPRRPDRRVAVNRPEAAARQPAVSPAPDARPPAAVVPAETPPAVSPDNRDMPPPPPQPPQPEPAAAVVTEPERPPEPAVEPDAGSAPPGVETPSPAPAGPAAGSAAPAGTAQPRVPNGDALAIVAVPAVVEQPPRRIIAQPPEVPAVSRSGHGLLLHRPPADADRKPVHGTTGWAVLPPGRALAAREDLIAPPGCRPEIHVRGSTIRLEPQSRVTLTTDADGTPRLELVFGRVAIHADEEGARLGLTAGGLSGVVMDGRRNPIGVEVELDREPGAAAGEQLVRATIATTTAGMRWRQTGNDGGDPERPLEGLQPDGLLEAGRRIVWDGREPDRAAVLPGRDLDWIAAPPRIDRLDATAAAAMQARLAGDQPLEKSLRDMAADRREREENRTLAAATLALVGDYGDLVRLLCTDSGPTGLRSGRWRKLEEATVPLALARGVNAAEALTRAFAEHAPAGRGRDLVALARGTSDADLAAGADARLVELLDAPELVVRRYALRNLDSIVPGTATGRPRYDPDWSVELRRDAVAAWRKELEQGRIRRPAAPPP